MTEHTGRRVDVYYNFHRECWSVKSMEPDADDYGRVIGHVDRVVIDDPDFVVQPSGLRKYRTSGDRNVHAFVRGGLLATDDDATTGRYRSWAFDYRPRDERFLHSDCPFVFHDPPNGRLAKNLNPDRVYLGPKRRYGLFDYTLSNSE